MSALGTGFAFGAGAGFRFLAAARAAGAAAGVDPPALGAALLAAALFLGLCHVPKSNRSAAAEPPLDQVPRGVEAADRHVLRVAGERRRRDQPDQLRLQRPGAERRRQLAHRARPPCPAAPPAGRGRWSRPGRGRWRAASPIARTPRSPPPASRSPAATARATSRSPLSSSTLKAASGGRAVTRVAPARAVRQRGPEVGAQLARLHPQPQLRQAAVAEVGALGPHRARGPARRRGRRGCRGRRSGSPTATASVRAASRSAGLEPDERADVERPDRRVGAARSAPCRSSPAASSAPATSASVSGPGSPARVKTVRSWSASVWRSSSVAPRLEGLLQPLQTLARRCPRRRWERRAGPACSQASRCPGSDQQLAAADDRLAVDLDRRLEQHAVEVDRDLDRAADRRRGAEGDVAVPRIFSSSRMLPVRIASSLVPIPSSATLVAVRPVRRQQLHQPGAVGAGRCRPGGPRGWSARSACRAGRRRRSSRRRPACPRRSPRSGR